MSILCNFDDEEKSAKDCMSGKFFWFSGINLAELSTDEFQNHCNDKYSIECDQVFNDNDNFINETFKTGRYFKLTGSFTDNNELEDWDYNNNIDIKDGKHNENEYQDTTGTWFVFAGYSQKNSDDGLKSRNIHNGVTDFDNDRQSIAGSFNIKTFVEEAEPCIKATFDNVKLDLGILEREDDTKDKEFFDEKFSIKKKVFEFSSQEVQETEQFSEKFIDNVNIDFNTLDKIDKISNGENSSIEIIHPKTNTDNKIFCKNSLELNENATNIVNLKKHSSDNKVNDENFVEVLLKLNLEEMNLNFEDFENESKNQNDAINSSDGISLKNEPQCSPKSRIIIKSHNKNSFDKSFSVNSSVSKSPITIQSEKTPVNMSRVIRKSSSILKKGVSKSLDYSSSEDEAIQSLKRSRSFRRSIVIQDEEGEAKKKQSGIFVSINFITPSSPFDKESNEVKTSDVHQSLRSVLLFLENMAVSIATFAEYFDAVKQLNTIFWELKSSQENETKNNFSSVLDYLVYSDWPKVVLSCLQKLMMSYPHVFTEYECIEKIVYYGGHMPSVLRMNRTTPEFAVSVIFDGLLKVAINFTSLHEPSRLACCEDKLVYFLIAEVLPKLHNIMWGKSTARESFLKSICELLYNCSQSASNVPILISNGCVSILSDMLRATLDIQDAQKPSITMLMILSFMIDQSNHEVIFDETSVIRLLQFLDKSLEHSEHIMHDFFACDLANCLSRIASNEIIRELIVQNSGQELLYKFLRHAYNDNEKISACNALWSIAFNKEAKDIIRGMGKLMSFLLKLKESENDELRQAASGVIWECVEKYELKDKQDSLSSTDHIFISYEYDSEPLVVLIKEELQRNGFTVWMKKNEQGINMQTVTSEIQSSSIFIAAITRKYKQSPKTFSELDYAHTLRKHIIPLKLESNFCLDGWLGDMMKVTNPIDFSNEFSQKVSLESLVDLVKISLGHSTLNEKVPFSPENGVERSKDILKWTNDDVIEWLKENKLIKFANIGKRLLKITGLHLLMFYDLKKQSPDYYYSVLDTRLGLKDILDTLEFTYALDRLLGNEPLL